MCELRTLSSRPSVGTEPWFCPDAALNPPSTMIRKLADGSYRLYSKKKDSKAGKRRNLGTFRTRKAAEKHEREVQYFKRH